MRKLSYGKTFNLGNYESERIDLEIEVDHWEHIEEAFAQLREKVHQLHETPLGEPEPPELPW